MTIWFTADQHLGHKGAIRHCSRPWSTIEDMNAAILANYRAVVQPEDIVYMLGDFAWRGADKLILELPGHIHYVHGNHDKGRVRALAPHLASWQEYLEINIDEQHVVLFHYPILDWNRRFRGAWHLHGHCHGNYPNAPGRLDVGVDCHAYSPCSWEQVKSLIVPFTAKSAKEDMIHQKEIPCECSQ